LNWFDGLWKGLIRFESVWSILNRFDPFWNRFRIINPKQALRRKRGKRARKIKRDTPCFLSLKLAFASSKPISFQLEVWVDWQDDKLSLIGSVWFFLFVKG
jgi:hypothetical protein